MDKLSKHSNLHMEINLHVQVLPDCLGYHSGNVQQQNTAQIMK
jgi:hypothetical protein